MENVVQKATNQGIIIVASTSNYRKEEILYPSQYENVLSVIPADKKGGFIYGLEYDEGSKHIKSPGKDIVTTLKQKDRLYTPVDGASIATAITCGILARIKYENIGLTNEQIIDIAKENHLI